MAEEKKVEAYKDSVLTDKEKEDKDFVEARIAILKESRKNHYGIDLDALWSEADTEYIPHRLKTNRKKVSVQNDENTGWRNTSTLVKLGSNDWQSDVAEANPFIKIQTALSIMIDQNPSGIFTPMAKKFQATTELIHQLYKRSWEYARSKGQLKLFVFNLAKYGWACGRTYPLRITKTVKILKTLDPDNPDNNEYEEKEVVEFNDVMRENLDPRNTWIDDMAKPNNDRSINDWVYRKVYTMEQAEKEFGQYDNWKYVKADGTITDTIEEKNDTKELKADNLVEVYFYENLARDLLYVKLGGVPVIIEPLPISNFNGAKKLSLWQTYWNIRHGQSPYGIGIWEAIRHSSSQKDRISNMTTDQLTMSIYKMFFYQGTQSLTETGDIVIMPGVGKQVLDPKNISWMNVPGPGKDAYEGMKMYQERIDESSGVGDPLTGAITGKTAFELAQAKESALKRLKDPLNNILEALNTEGYITVSLMQLMYSIPEIKVIASPELQAAYLEEIGGDEELYERDTFEDEETGEVTSEFRARIFPEFPLNLDEDDQKNLVETEETKFFRIKPRFLNWEGIINIKSQSILTPSKQVDKALDLEMYQLLNPLFVQAPQLYAKVAEAIVKLYEKDPKDILPDSWVQFLAQGPEQGAAPEGQIPPEEGLPQGGGGQAQPQQAQQLQTGQNAGQGTPPAAAQNPGGNLFKKIGDLASKANPFRSTR